MAGYCNAEICRLTQDDQVDGPKLRGQLCSTHCLFSDDKFCILGMPADNAEICRLTQDDQVDGPKLRGQLCSTHLLSLSDKEERSSEELWA